MNDRYIKSPSVELLERMEADIFRKRHPQMPEAAITPIRHRDDLANGLTKCVIRFLQLKGWQAERINTTGRPIDTRRRFDVCGCQRQVGSLRWVYSTSTVGSADISATVAGCSVKIEIKVGRDRQSARQKAYAEAVERAGGLYVVASTFEEFLGWYGITFGGHADE